MDKNNYTHMPPAHPSAQDIALQRLWDKVKATFADKNDVLAIVKELQKIEKRQAIRAVQSGVNGPVQPVGSDGIAHVEYEDWVETEGLNAAGQPVHVYNDSKNALTTAAAAMVIKQIRHDVSRIKNFEIVVCEANQVDEQGQPVVPSANQNTIYLTPSGNDQEGFTWNEWIWVLKNPGDGRLNPHWEQIGNKEIDLRWVKGDIAKLNHDIKKTNESIRKVSDALANAILKRAVKPLEELQEYLKSEEFITYVFEQLPRAAMGTDGLMTANSFAILSMLSIWASNDWRVNGGGSLGADYVIALFEKTDFAYTDELKKQFLGADSILP